MRVLTKTLFLLYSQKLHALLWKGSDSMTSNLLYKKALNRIDKELEYYMNEICICNYLIQCSDNPEELDKKADEYTEKVLKLLELERKIVKHMK